MQYTKIQIGKSVNGTDIPVYVNTTAADTYTYLLAGVHGNEPEGVFVLEKLFAWLQTQNIAAPLIIIPILNPDGYAARTRVNANAVDLNRNWPTSNWAATYTEDRYCPGHEPLSEPENVFLHELFKQYIPQLIVSFHSLRPILNCNTAATLAATNIAEFNKYIVSEDIGYPTPGSLGTYVDEVLQCGIITYELPELASGISLDEIWSQNCEGLHNYFTNLRISQS